MGDLAADTELTASGEGAFTRLRHRDWEIWGPNGGYLATLALRAAGLHCGRARPANITVHFLGVATCSAGLCANARRHRSRSDAFCGL